MRKLFTGKLKFLISLTLAIALFPTIPVISASAEEPLMVSTVINPEKAVSIVLSDEVTASGISARGIEKCQVGAFTNGSDAFGMDNGLILTTGYAGNIAGVTKKGSDGISKEKQKDKDLRRITQQSLYDICSLEFVVDNSSKNKSYLTFDYAFASSSFNQVKQFHDCFGLFVDYNLDGKYDENIAKLPDGQEVSVQNLINGNYYTGSGDDTYVNSFNGVSNVFTARTSKPVNGKVGLKLVIGDSFSNLYNSAIFIKGKSISIGKQIEPPVISGDNHPKGVLDSEFQDKETTCTYQWYLADSDGASGTPLEGETSDKLNVTESMVGKYAYLVVTGTGEYTGTATSNYILIEDIPWVQEKFSYYTTFHYTEPYRLTTFGKGEGLTAYYYVTDKAIAPTPDEMLKMGTAVECRISKVINGVTYSGADCPDKILTKDIGNHIYVMFAKQGDKEIICSGVKDRQLLALFKNAKSLGLSEMEVNACNSIVGLYEKMLKLPDEDMGENTAGIDLDNSSIKDYKGVSLSEDFSKDIKLTFSRTFGWKITGTVPFATENYGVVLYNCNKNNLADMGYSRQNLPLGEELLKIEGLEVYSLKDNNLKINGTEFTVFNNEVTPTEMDTDFLFALWYMDSEGNLHMERTCYKNVLDSGRGQAELSQPDEKEVLVAMENVFWAVKTLCS